MRPPPPPQMISLLWKERTCFLARDTAQHYICMSGGPTSRLWQLWWRSRAPSRWHQSSRLLAGAHARCSTIFKHWRRRCQRRRYVHQVLDAPPSWRLLPQSHMLSPQPQDASEHARLKNLSLSRRAAASDVFSAYATARHVRQHDMSDSTTCATARCPPHADRTRCPPRARLCRQAAQSDAAIDGIDSTKHSCGTLYQVRVRRSCTRSFIARAHAYFCLQVEPSLPNEDAAVTTAAHAAAFSTVESNGSEAATDVDAVPWALGCSRDAVKNYVRSLYQLGGPRFSGFDATPRQVLKCLRVCYSLDYEALNAHARRVREIILEVADEEEEKLQKLPSSKQSCDDDGPPNAPTSSPSVQYLAQIRPALAKQILEARRDLPRIDKTNAERYPMPDLKRYKGAAQRQLDSKPALWYWQMTGGDWDGEAQSYSLATKKYRRDYDSEYKETERQREQKRRKATPAPVTGGEECVPADQMLLPVAPAPMDVDTTSCTTTIAIARAADSTAEDVTSPGEVEPSDSAVVYPWLQLGGERTQCLADALAHALKVNKELVRAGIGEDRCFARAAAYVDEAFPEFELVNITASLASSAAVPLNLFDRVVGSTNRAGALDLPLLNSTHDDLLLSMAQFDKWLYHCAYFSPSATWERADPQSGCMLLGRGILKDNQSNMPTHLAVDMDRASEEAARAFFAEPYAAPWHIQAVYQLMPRDATRAKPDLGKKLRFLRDDTLSAAFQKKLPRPDPDRVQHGALERLNDPEPRRGDERFSGNYDAFRDAYKLWHKRHQRRKKRSPLAELPPSARRLGPSPVGHAASSVTSAVAPCLAAASTTITQHDALGSATITASVFTDSRSVTAKRDPSGAITVTTSPSAPPIKSTPIKSAPASASRQIVAPDLLAINAQRDATTRHPCPPDGTRMAAFEATFPFEPSADQWQTFAEVARDMIDSPRPMERLVCGDVGFGKTEVAMRAIYRAVCAGRQAAFLAPTEALATQHLCSLVTRMPDVRVKLLSSHLRQHDMAAIKLAAHQRKLDVLVGTSAILAPDVSFAKLGLLVVDEEQLFGTRQKEIVKHAAISTDVLLLSATPIPRTLYTATEGVRTMSRLTTPPSGRHAVRTVVCGRDDQQIIGAVKAELARNGQVLYIVPRVAMLQGELGLFRELLPGARVDVAHAELSDLALRIAKFSDGLTDVLVATTVVECGIDIPNANTIIILEAVRVCRRPIRSPVVHACATCAHASRLCLVWIAAPVWPRSASSAARPRWTRFGAGVRFLDASRGHQSQGVTAAARHAG